MSSVLGRQRRPPTSLVLPGRLALRPSFSHSVPSPSSTFRTSLRPKHLQKSATKSLVVTMILLHQSSWPSSSYGVRWQQHYTPCNEGGFLRWVETHRLLTYVSQRDVDPNCNVGRSLAQRCNFATLHCSYEIERDGKCSCSTIMGYWDFNANQVAMKDKDYTFLASSSCYCALWVSILTCLTYNTLSVSLLDCR